MPVRLSVDANVVRVDWEGAQTDEELRSFFADLASTLDRLDRFAIVYDARRAAVPTWSQRQLLAELTRIAGPNLRRRCVGVAFVVESALLRAGVSAMLWIQPMALPHTLKGSVGEAIAWCNERLGPTR